MRPFKVASAPTIVRENNDKAIIDMNAQVIQLSDNRTEIHVCRCCGHVTTVIEQPSLVPGRKLTQIECHTPGCGSWYKTVYARDVEQVSEYYLAIGLDVDQLPALVEGIEVMSSVYA